MDPIPIILEIARIAAGPIIGRIVSAIGGDSEPVRVAAKVGLAFTETMLDQAASGAEPAEALRAAARRVGILAVETAADERAREKFPTLRSEGEK